MSNAPQGPDWWQASDDKWYPPPRPAAPGDATAQSDITREAAAPAEPRESPPLYGGSIDPTIHEVESPPDPTLVHPQAPPVPPAVPWAYPSAPAPGSGGYATPPPAQPAAPSAPGSGAYATAPPQPAQPGPPGGSPPFGVPPSSFPSYGQVPPSPTGPSQTRAPLFITLGIVVVLAIVAAVVVASSGDDETADPTTTTTSSTSTTTGGDSTTTTSVGGEPPVGPMEAPYPSGHEDLVIVEQGYSVSPDESDADTLSYGALIENTGDRVAVICSIVVEISDADGNTVTTHDTAWLSAILPGQTFGLGISDLGVTGEPAGMALTLGAITWDDPASYGDISVEPGDTSFDSYQRPTTSYTAESSYESALEQPFAWIVHRNAEGDIVGGDGAYMNEPLVPGQPVDDEITTTGPIEAADAAAAEVWIEPVTTDCQSNQPGEPDEEGEI